MAKLANRFMTTQQVGFLLGYLGTRVLGQYDIALLSAEAEPGKLLFVEENIRATAASLDVPLDDFRIWIALHETTHAFEFEANTWLRPYLRDHLERQLTGVLDQAKSIQADGIGAPHPVACANRRTTRSSASSGRSSASCSKRRSG